MPRSVKYKNGARYVLYEQTKSEAVYLDAKNQAQIDGYLTDTTTRNGIYYLWVLDRYPKNS